MFLGSCILIGINDILDTVQRLRPKATMFEKWARLHLQKEKRELEPTLKSSLERTNPWSSDTDRF
jgi:hypothetical protein